jgi:hypothetical protein
MATGDVVVLVSDLCERVELESALREVVVLNSAGGGPLVVGSALQIERLE